MDLYFDSCCYGRPKDNQNDAIVRAETKAIAKIISTRRMNGHTIIGSSVIVAEIRRTPDDDVREANMRFYNEAFDRDADLTETSSKRAASFRADGLKLGDSLHLAIAESEGADVLLTVDKKFLKIVTNKNLSRVMVINPLNLNIRRLI